MVLLLAVCLLLLILLFKLKQGGIGSFHENQEPIMQVSLPIRKMREYCTGWDLTDEKKILFRD